MAVLPHAIPATERRPMTIEDTLSFKVVSDAQISPDGSRVAFVVGDVFKERGAPQPRSGIWMVRTDGGEARPFSAAPGSDLAPRWSPDGRALAFLSDRTQPGTFQLYVWRDGQGEARPLPLRRAIESTSVGPSYRVELASSVGTPVWSPDGSRIALLIGDPLDEQEEARRASGNDVIEFERHPRYTRVWVVDVETGAAHVATPGDLQVWEFDWSIDGRFALVISDRPDESSWYESRLAVLDQTGKEPRTVYKPPRPTARNGRVNPRGRQIATPRWSPDGRLISFITCTWSDRGLIGGDVYVVPAEGGDPRNLTEGQPASVSWTDWQPDGSAMLVAAWYEGEQALAIVTIAPAGLRVVWQDQVALADRYQPRFTRSRAAALVAVREDPRHPREVWLASNPLAGPPTWRPLTALQPSLDGIALASCETLHWHGRDGVPVQGLLLRPSDAPPGRLPLVVWPHGGPTFLHQYSFHGWVPGAQGFALELIAARGMAVLLPNMRGSLGWGTQFAEATVGDHGGEDLQDVLAGVDHCVASGIADPDRLGIGGWSSGGYLAPWATCQTDRFSAALMGAGVSDLRTMHAGRSVYWGWIAIVVSDDPYKPGGEHDQRSPLTHVARVRTPTLIIHGEDDHILPVDQAYAYYRGLREHGQTVELVIYPREVHGIRERQHQLDIARRVPSWFERWLLRPDKRPNS